MNERNLIVPSSEEARKNGRKGGIKSGETRRRKATMRTAMRQLLSLPVQDIDTWDALSELGVEPGQMDNQTALLAAVLVRGIRTGDVKAMQAIAAIIGEDNDAERLKLQKKQALDKKQGDEGMLAEVLAALKDDDSAE